MIGLPFDRLGDKFIASAFREVVGPDGGRIRNDEIADFVRQRASELQASDTREGSDARVATQERVKAAMQRTPGALGAIDGAMAYGLNWTELLEARAAVAELATAVRERMELSRGGRQPTGPYAESDARIEAALARVDGAK